MSIGLHLDMTCDVQRPNPTTDPYNNQQQTPQAHLTAVPCRLLTRAQQGFSSLTGQWVVDTAYKLLVEHHRDLAAGDRIVNLKDETGATVAGNFEVASSIAHRGVMVMHKTVQLRKVS